jgi:hypothetical protein
VKCGFMARAGRYKLENVVAADPLNIQSGIAAPPAYLRNPSCLAGGRSDSRD